MSDAAWAAVDLLSAGIRDVLSDDLVSLYVHGSLVAGGFVEGKSDIDLLAIVGHGLHPEQVDRLSSWFASSLATIPCDVDLRIVTTAVAATPSAPGWTPTLAYELEVRPTSDEPLRTVRGPAVEPDLVIELSQVRAAGRALVGPEPSKVIGEVRHDQVTAVNDGHLARWLEIPFNPGVDELMVFTACRAWRFAETGEHVSKVDSATWVLAQRPDLDVVAQALTRRRGGDGLITAKDTKELMSIAREKLTGRTP